MNLALESMLTGLARLRSLILQAERGVGCDLLADVRQAVAAVRGKVLGHTHFAQEIGFERKHLLSSLAAVEFAEQSCCAFGDRRVGVCLIEALAAFERRYDPQLG